MELLEELWKSAPLAAIVLAYVETRFRRGSARMRRIERRQVAIARHLGCDIDSGPHLIEKGNNDD